MQRFPTAIVPLVLLVSCGMIGCVSPLPSSRDATMNPSSSDSAMLDLDSLPGKVKGTAKTLTGQGYDPEKARKLYGDAEAEYRQASLTQVDRRRGLFRTAAKGFAKAATHWPDSALEQDALFMAGEANFFADRYPDANESYELLLKKYPNSKHLDTVESRRFSIAQYWLAMHENDPDSFWTVNLLDDTRPWRDTFGNAVRIFDRIRIDDPTGKLADDATLAAGNAYFASKKYLDADNFYTDLRSTFPSSEHQFRAHLLGLQTKLRSYEGPNYSGVPLDEAERLVKQIRRQFPQEAGKDHKYLDEAYAEIQFKKAEREWRMASYYDRRGEYGAARFYYNLLAQDYRQTPFAASAVERVADLSGEPDVPPQRLEWLVSIFPEQEDVQPLMANGASPSLLR